MPRTFVIAQGGGPTAVINQTLAGAVGEIERRYPDARILGSRHGVRGIRDGDYVDFSEVPAERMRKIGKTPGAALGSTRDKPDAAYCDLVLKGLQKVGADAFIYIGGNDTAGTQQILSDAAGGSIAFVHAPKSGAPNQAGRTHIRQVSYRPASSSPARSAASISTSGRCRASMSASSWDGTRAF